MGEKLATPNLYGTFEGRVKKAVLRLYRNANELMCQGRFEEVSSLLEHAELESLPPELLVGWLRITFPARQEIDGWENSYQKVSIELKNRGLEPSVLLVGLLR